MKYILVLLGAWCVIALSCTKEKTDYHPDTTPGAPGHAAFNEAATAHSGGYDIHIQTPSGAFHQGYNAMRVHLTDDRGNTADGVADVVLRPLAATADGGQVLGTAPHPEALAYRPDSAYFDGYAVFTAVSDAQQAWTLDIHFTAAGEPHAVQLPITVTPQPNPNRGMAAFTGNDGTDYLVALVAPQQPQVGENDLVAAIYRREAGSTPPWIYAKADDYTLLLDPRMPEPSMGNHSSPNNVDLTQHDDGLYHGVVNYTMTGNWTLNFILLDPDGNVVKGTEVPADFTPGQEGVRSELHIDILF